MIDEVVNYLNKFESKSISHIRINITHSIIEGIKAHIAYGFVYWVIESAFFAFDDGCISLVLIIIGHEPFIIYNNRQVFRSFLGFLTVNLRFFFFDNLLLNNSYVDDLIESSLLIRDIYVGFPFGDEYLMPEILCFESYFQFFRCTDA